MLSGMTCFGSAQPVMSSLFLPHSSGGGSLTRDLTYGRASLEMVSEETNAPATKRTPYYRRDLNTHQSARLVDGSLARQHSPSADCYANKSSKVTAEGDNIHSGHGCGVGTSNDSHLSPPPVHIPLDEVTMEHLHRVAAINRQKRLEARLARRDVFAQKHCAEMIRSCCHLSCTERRALPPPPALEDLPEDREIAFNPNQVRLDPANEQSQQVIALWLAQERIKMHHRSCQKHHHRCPDSHHSEHLKKPWGQSMAFVRKRLLGQS